MTPYDRPMMHLRAVEARYPGAWTEVHNMRADRGRRLPEWPAWCFLPLAGAYAIVSGGGENRVPLERMPDVGVLGALAAWRQTRGIYEYDETILEALWQTPVEGEIPVEVLYRLPEWCVYVLTPGRQWTALPLNGFFAHLEWDAGTERQELRLVLDVRQSELLVPLPLHLGHGGVSAALAAAAQEARRQAAAFGVDISTAIEAMARLGSASQLEPLVSALLYLCTEAAEIHERAIEGAGREHPRRPPQRAPAAPVTWAVGYRLGAALREAEAREDRGVAPAPTGSHARPRAHIRRAHWHTYLTGHGRSVPQLRWLPPIPVNVDLGDIVPTIRRVE